MVENLFKKNRSPLNIGIMCRGFIFSSWEAECLRSLLRQDKVKISLLILEDSTGDDSLFSKTRNLLLDFNHLFFSVYQKFFFNPSTLQPVDLSKFLEGIPFLNCKTFRKKKFSHYFKDTDIKIIKKYNLDAILKFKGFGIIRGDILKVALHGVWSFHVGDECKYRGAPPVFWELYYGERKVGAILQKLTERLDAGVILKKKKFPIYRYSYIENLKRIHKEIYKWPVEVCNDILENRAYYFTGSSSETDAPIYHEPNNVQILIFMLKMFKNRITKK